ncbi:MAG: site-2 protease family protein [Anaerolineales bacterium]
MLERLSSQMPETSADLPATLREAVARVMSIQDMTLGRAEGYTVRFRGKLTTDPTRAYDELEQVFHENSHTPLFRVEDGLHVITALPGVVNPRKSNPFVNALLFLATLASVLFTGAILGFDESPVDPNQLLLEGLRQIHTGWPFAVSLLAILGAHEFGHYFAARHHKAPVTLPYFLPLPFPLSVFGTLGAVIQMKAPIRNRRVLLDIGIAGPIAGFIVAIPVLLIGLHLSELTTLPRTGFSMEGNSIIYLLSKFVVYGKLLPEPASYQGLPAFLYWIIYFFTGQPSPAGALDVSVHPVAWAGWAGLLVTGLNLIPAGQLDGGHTLFVLLGRRVRALLPVVIGVLVLLGLVWQGWWLWAALIFFLGRRHAELLDEITPLDPGRRFLALMTLVLFLLVITPVPLRSF